MSWQSILFIIIICTAILFFVLLKFRARLSRSPSKLGGSDSTMSRGEVIHILGMQGSGKSYIVDKFRNDPNYLCLDTDDIMIEAYYNLRNSSKRDLLIDTMEHFDNEKMRVFRDKIAGADDKTIILAGMTLRAANIKSAIGNRKFTGYILKADDSELESWFRRAMKRDYNKLYNNRDKILHCIDNSPAKFIGLDIEMSLGGLGLSIPEKYSDYKNGYDEMIANEKGYLPITQDELIKQLKIYSVEVKGEMDAKLELVPITKQTFEHGMTLSIDTTYISPPAVIMAQAYIIDHCKAVLLRKGSEYIGIATYGYDNFIGEKSNPAQWKLYKIAIAKPHLGKGCGSQFLKLILEDIPKDVNIRVSVHKENTPAIALYKKYSFEKSGNEDGDSISMMRFPIKS